MANLEKILDYKKSKCVSSSETFNSSTSRDVCDVIWDGIMCWPRTPAGILSIQKCPEYMDDFNQSGTASKMCMSDGYWWFNPEKNTTWTNFSLCTVNKQNTDHESSWPTELMQLVSGCGPDAHGLSAVHPEIYQNWFPVIKLISQTGYTVSLATLLISLGLLASIKKLRCPRNMLHVHLFLSFINRAFMTLLKDKLFVQGLGLPSDIKIWDGEIIDFEETSHWPCRLIVSMKEYSILANYSWILMEGLYLHNLIFLALFTDSSAITLYIILGWGLPAVFVIVWVVAKSVYEDKMCWTSNKDPLVCIMSRLPITVYVLLSFALFVNIVRVLLVKLSSSVNFERRRMRYRRWAKSTLVLVPLFGVHYTLFLAMSYGTSLHSTVELIWLFFDQLFASFQGFFVSLLYCLLNSEVRLEVSRKWRSWRQSMQKPSHQYGSGRSVAAGLYSVMSLTRFQFRKSTRADSMSQECVGHNGSVPMTARSQKWKDYYLQMNDVRSETNDTTSLPVIPARHALSEDCRNRTEEHLVISDSWL